MADTTWRDKYMEHSLEEDREEEKEEGSGEDVHGRGNLGRP